jgi:capsular exopolysaccharide synthesis family protein
MNSLPAVVGSGPILTELEQRLGTTKAPQIEVEFPAESELMLIVVQDLDAALAAQAANTLAELVTESLKTTRTGRKLNVTLVDPAVVPLRPSSPRLVLNLGAGVAVGLIGGLGLAFLFENLDTTLYTTEEIETFTETQVVGQIPEARREPPTVLNPDSVRGDAFRRLYINLFGLNGQRPNRTLVITSAGPGEGKSTVVTHLAQMIAQTRRQVAVVDCDLRRPDLHRIYGLANDIGLSSVLLKEVALTDAIQPCDIPGVHVLTSGPPLNPTDLLGLPEMSCLLEELACDFDHILLDTPPLLPVVDAAAIAPSVDGALLVIKHAQVRREELQDVLRQLAFSHINLVGVVVNRAGDRRRYSGRYYPAPWGR